MIYLPRVTDILFILGSVLLVSVMSLVGVFLLSLQESLLRKFLLPLVAFATGALFANVFLHLLPEVVEEAADPIIPFALVLAEIVPALVIEKFIHWHHCHTIDCPDHTHPIGTMMLIGDGVHNMMDGILIAGAYLASTELGIATTVAVILHEIPQEIGDFAVLIHSGFTKSRALFYNFLSACTAFLGVILVLLLQNIVPHIELILLPLTAGNFLYIAGSDLLPELHREVHLSSAFRQLVFLLLGIGIMAAFLLGVGEPAHEQEEVGIGEHYGANMASQLKHDDTIFLYDLISA